MIQSVGQRCCLWERLVSGPFSPPTTNRLRYSGSRRRTWCTKPTARWRWCRWKSSRLKRATAGQFDAWPWCTAWGNVAASEASVAIAVSCPHRSEAFEAAKWLIDQLKHQVPIWKQEHYVQHGAEWIHPTAGNCHCGSASKVVVANDNASALDGNELVNHSQTACAENSGTVHLQAEASRP
jgi:hypothetical protein